ncbi:MAG: DNA polymerase III subunit gamma/tau [Ruminococcaceae bacterium]|nr:DNA polymerase III subunit gamma/tau [Oscillospiraceae bacterium]
MYLALYRKYRPSTFDDVISQEHITTTLKNQIATGQIAHAYLFTGTRGTGKTSCAKIMAKAVNCLSPVNGNPCGECKACKAIADGTTDIIEIDAASNNGVDSIRQIRDEVIYTPIDCKYKVYIIDEVHMLSDSAFNALLKTLEEPPEHVIFILATTEYYKVPATILSRCQQFLFSKIDPEEAKKRLLEVAEKENITLTENAAALIARLSDGAMRDAWSLLDQCVSSSSTVDEEAVRKSSGVADSGYLFAFSEAVIKQKPAEALKLLDDLIGKGKDLCRLIEELTLHYRNLMLTKTVDSSFVKGTDEELKRYSEQCKKLSLDEIMRQVDLVSDSLDNINRMKQTGQARLLTEQLFIRLCSPKLTSDGKALAARLGALENRLDNLSLGNIAHSEPKAVSEPAADTKSELIPDPDALSAPFDFGDTADSETKQIAPEKTEAVSKEEPQPSIREDEAAPLLQNAPPVSNEAQPDFPFDIDDIPLPEPPPFGDSAQLDEIPLPPEEPAANFTDSLDKPVNNPAAEVPHKTENEKQTDSESRGGTPKTKEKADDDEKEKQPALPIPESSIELPSDSQPLAQWNDIISLLPAASKNILKSASAYLYGGKIYVDAPTSALSMLQSGRRAVKLREAVKTVMGGKLDIFTLPEKAHAQEEKEDLVTPFLNRAREMGIEVTVKDR